MKMSNSGSEQRDHGTARCAHDEGGGNAPVSTATWWRDHRSRRRSRRPKNIKKNWLLAEATKHRTEKRERERPRKRKEEEEEKEEERKKRKKKKKRRERKKEKCRRKRKGKEKKPRTAIVERKTVSRLVYTCFRKSLQKY
ncbi:hypothetical protein ACOSP7_020615 [Xanthoceras sorbifolium]